MRKQVEHCLRVKRHSSTRSEFPVGHPLAYYCSDSMAKMFWSRQDDSRHQAPETAHLQRQHKQQGIQRTIHPGYTSAETSGIVNGSEQGTLP